MDFALAVWRRRKWPAVIIFAALFAAIGGAARSLPDIYQSTATVLVEHQQAPERLIGATAESEAEQEARIRAVSEQILSRARLYELIVRFHLYPEQRGKTSPEAVADRMRKDIRLEFKEIHDLVAWRTSTVAFTVSYRGRDPISVAEVTNALAALLVEENARIRERRSAGTSEFLRSQLEQARRYLQAQERQVSEFKARHIGQLPEQQAANLAALERLNAQLRMTVEPQLRVMERRDELARRLADVAAETPKPDSTAARLTELRQELAELGTRFTDDHPEIVRIKAEIAELQRGLAEEVRRADPAASSASQVRQLKGALAEADAELAALRNEERALRRAIAGYERRVANAPRTELALQQISRDYDTAKQQYQSLVERVDEAQLAERVEQRRQGGQFRIVQPAVASHQPVAPNRLLIFVMGLMLSTGAAVGVALLAETRDTSFHTVDDLRGFTSVPVLVSIPPIVTGRELVRRRARLALGALATALGVVVIVATMSYIATDNELLLRILTRGRF